MQEEEARGSDNLKYKCRCSFLEIYNEQVADLLEPSSSNLQVSFALTLILLLWPTSCSSTSTNWIYATELVLH